MGRTYYMREGEHSPRMAPFSLRLTQEERAKLEARASTMPLGAYIKSLIFAEDAPKYRARRKGPVADSKALAELLACLGASRIANNLNQFAKAANVGELLFDEETKGQIARASGDIAAMRGLLMRALGLKEPGAPPPNETVAQTFTRASAPTPPAAPSPSGKRFGL